MGKKYAEEDDIMWEQFRSIIPICILIPHSKNLLRKVDDKHTYLDYINQGIKNLFNTLKKDETISNLQAMISVVSYNAKAEVVQDFVKLEDLKDDFQIQESDLKDGCNLGLGISKAINQLEKIKHFYIEVGLDYYYPWLFIFTDGETDDLDTLKKAIDECLEFQVFALKSCVYVLTHEKDMEKETLNGLPNPIPLSLENIENYFCYLDKRSGPPFEKENIEQDSADSDVWFDIDL